MPCHVPLCPRCFASSLCHGTKAAPTHGVPLFHWLPMSLAVPNSRDSVTKAPLCRQPSAGSGRWWQELCQPPWLACLLQCQFINIEELIRILQPFPLGPLLQRLEDTCCLQDFAAALLKGFNPALSQPGGLCPSLPSQLTHVAKAP